MNLWIQWYKKVRSFQATCSRRLTYQCLVLVLIGFTLRRENDGVTSLIRGVGLQSALYKRLLHFFNGSGALCACSLTRIWVKIVLESFRFLTVMDHIVLLVDGIKNPKEGKKMPGVKTLHQESSNNSKPPFILGHSIQALSILVESLPGRIAAVPLLSRIHEGVKKTPKDKRTLLDKMVEMVLMISLLLPLPVYVVGDNYYASGDLMAQLMKGRHHLITRAKKNTKGYRHPLRPEKRGRGRPAKYGEKVNLIALFESARDFIQDHSPLPGDRNTPIAYRAEILLWTPLKGEVLFVWVKHPVKGNLILMSTDLTLPPREVIRLYGYRFQIELGFRDAVQSIGTYAYHFWMKSMDPIQRRDGDQYLHRKDPAYREQVDRKLEAYHRYMQCGNIAHGLLMYLSLYHSQSVWGHFHSWYRTLNTQKAPSVRVVAYAMQFGLLEYLRVMPPEQELRKILEDNIDMTQVPDFQLAA